MQKLQYGQSLPPKKDSHANPGKEAHEGEVSPGIGHTGPKPEFEASKPFRSKKGDRFS